MSVRWTRPAQQDLAGIDDWFSDKNPAFAERVGRAAVNAGEFLAAHREAGEEIRPGIRRWHVPRTPYLLFYQIGLDQIDILHVRHERQDLPDTW